MPKPQKSELHDKNLFDPCLRVDVPYGHVVDTKEEKWGKQTPAEKFPTRSKPLIQPPKVILLALNKKVLKPLSYQYYLWYARLVCNHKWLYVEKGCISPT